MSPPECAPTIQHLPDAVKTWDSGLECPPGEIWFALTQADSFGVTLFKYSDKADHKKAGRVIMMIGAAVKNVDFRKKCPMLCGLYDAYQRTSKSFVFMVNCS